jgi:DNA-directed RNA polymerase specialized sigma24 family protein
MEIGACCDAAITPERSGADEADRRLLTAIGAGSRSALRQLHSGYFSRLVRFFAYLIPSSASEVLDGLIADTLFDVWRTSATLGSDSSVHVAIMRLAWGHVSRQLANGEVRPPPAAPVSGSPDRQTQLASQAEDLEPLSAASEALPAIGRAVVYLVYSGHSRKEVADMLSIPCESVDARVGNWMVTRQQRSLPRQIANDAAEH